jgi:hypothetical protein
MNNLKECEQGKLSLVSERIVDLFDIKSSDINAWDIAWGLSQANRYNGQTPVPWDVLSHTAMCYALYMADGRVDPATALAILLHDAAEALIGEVVHPLKMMPQMAWFAELEDSITQTIFERFGLDWHAVDWKTLKHYDYLSVTHEIHWLKPTTNQDPFFRHIDVPIQNYRKLAKAQPKEYVGLLYQGARHFGAKDMQTLFEIPKILEPYIGAPAEVVSDDAVIPPPRSSADVDNMRI